MFRRKPWTITDFIENKTVSLEVAALMWLAIQYEMSMIVSGGTASGKTSLLGSITPFIQPNQRIISIEDRLPFIYEYISLAQSLMANTYIENKDLKTAIMKFKEAKKSNNKTLQNEQTFVRGAFIESRLMYIAELQENWGLADNFAQNTYQLMKKIM